MRLKEEIIREMIKDVTEEIKEGNLYDAYDKAFWKGYNYALKMVVQEPPADQIINKEYYD